jgi:hypothetical protein
MEIVKTTIFIFLDGNFSDIWPVYLLPCLDRAHREYLVQRHSIHDPHG